MNIRQTVFIVDDDEAVASSIRALLQSVNLAVETYPSAQAFLDHYDQQKRGCLVLDIRMPGMSGLQLQDTLKIMGKTIPIIFITGHGDIRMAVRAVQAGAVDFIEKPFHHQELLDRIHKALALDEERRSGTDLKKIILSRINSLTPREREIMELVVEGNSSKHIAKALSISPKTVDFHRAKLMEKMQTRTVLQLVRIVLAATEGTLNYAEQRTDDLKSQSLSADEIVLSSGKFSEHSKRGGI